MVISLQSKVEEKLSDYEVLRYYNPYYYKWRMQELYEDKQDLYYKSSGTTDFDSVIGIKSASMSVEHIGEHLVGLDEQIDRLEREYRKHREILYTQIQDWQESTLDDLNQYFKAQMRGEDLTISSIEILKRSLYQIEYEERNKRNKWAEKKQDAENRRKSRALLRKREKLKRRWNMTGKKELPVKI